MLKIINELSFFFEDCYREISVREYSRISKIAPPTASKILKGFEKEKLLIEREDKRHLLFKANRESETLKLLSKIYWQEKLSKLIDSLNNYYFNPTIILFGSVSKLECNKNSDIDLVVVSENTNEFKKLKDFEKKTGREIQMFVVKDIKDLKNEYLINNVLNGYTLQGEIKWI